MNRNLRSVHFHQSAVIELGSTKRFLACYFAFTVKIQSSPPPFNKSKLLLKSGGGRFPRTAPTFKMVTVKFSGQIPSKCMCTGTCTFSEDFSLSFVARRIKTAYKHNKHMATRSRHAFCSLDHLKGH